MSEGIVPIVQALIGFVFLIPIAALTYWFLCIRVREEACKGPIPLLHDRHASTGGRRSAGRA